ncbi:hypothetical protein [Kineococcus aurantiacus]|uniref:Secreted protein n=1 Tax=Kineococcus aurantiacus TaxID=37633 RepID=A0A7Y9DLW1_9ACTN|nr:hypothetical protein [Kineococcus aurantiacus]NYD23013.1 hypothetical protein [Kineococcus aurantiacus]
MRRPAVLLAALAPVAALALCPTGASASCVGPSLTVGPAPATTAPAPDPAPAPVPRTGSFDVAGEWFRDGCDDTAGTPACAPAPGESPLAGVDLVLEQGGTRWTLGTADAGGRRDRYAVRWTVELPPGVAPGGAVLTAAAATLPVLVGP